jgi:hypothetical protein
MTTMTSNGNGHRPPRLPGVTFQNAAGGYELRIEGRKVCGGLTARQVLTLIASCGTVEALAHAVEAANGRQAKA